eukprot:CAMPEP_0169083296 /NCGR_PEP_ID=MMETSP1015-20121227/12004_1 /TAXON_ID=342587 /ORGANISM="Karlodinium micrum, Strain CCMP2283" /LENGTH=627 /DNA_ID=CAMNT_0009143213 /DNA_START=70 /DNA_END=1953 /DNA_ORIENTATION=-
MDLASAELQPGMPEYEDLKKSLMSGIELKLSQTEDSMWRRGLKEIRRLQTEQQEFTAVVTDLKESQSKLIAENEQLHAALCDVTSRFEQVVTEVRNALRQIQQGAQSRPSPSPSVASTAASETAAPCLGGQVMHAAELAQGRVHVGHLERALQRYTLLPETFEDAWQRLGAIQDKALLASEINNIVESKLEIKSKVADEGSECRTLLLQYEDALIKLRKATLSELESKNAKRMSQDESFTEPTPPSSLGNLSMSLGLTPSWPTCAAGDSSAESFLTPPRASVPQEQSLLGETGWPSWQGQYMSPAFPDVRCQPVAPPAVLSLASALTEAPTYASPPPTVPSVPSCGTASTAAGGLQLQLAECLEEPRASSASVVLSTSEPSVTSAARGATAPTRLEGSASVQDREIKYATPPLGYLTVELQKEPDFTTLGMEVNEIHGGAVLQVTRVEDDGLVMRYNSAQSSEATMIKVHDCIMEVNRVRGNSGKMLQECKTQQSLILTIARASDNGFSPEALSLPSTGAMQGGSSFSDIPCHGSQCSPDIAELDRVLAEVAAPPPSWGRLRPEARVFVPSSASQVCDEKPSVEALDAETRVAKVEAAAVANASFIADASGGGSSSDQDKVARLLFP